MNIIFWGIIIASVVGLDQLTKYLAVIKLMPVGSAPFINGIIGFSYAENTGAAFSIMRNQRWVFIILSTVAIVMIIIYMINQRKNISPMLGISLSMIVGGGIGNQIDRFAKGYVVDFLEFQFVDFAIFNVADSFITVGAVLIIIYILFIDRTLLLDEKPKSVGNAATDTAGTEDSNKEAVSAEVKAVPAVTGTDEPSVNESPLNDEKSFAADNSQANKKSE